MKNRIKILIFAGCVVVLSFVIGFFFCKICVKNNANDTIVINAERLDMPHLLDVEYAKSISTAISNIEICNVNNDFAMKWRSEIDYYYNIIIGSATADYRQKFVEEQAAWEQYSQSTIKSKHCYLEQVYGSGTIVPVILSQYDYDLQRERAIVLYRIAQSTMSGQGDVLSEP